MEATEKKKKRNGGYYLKEKIAKLEAENKELQNLKEASDKFAELWKNKYHGLNERHETLLVDRDAWKKDAEAKQKDIEAQGRKISQLTADLKVVTGNLEATKLESSRQLNEMYKALGWFRQWIWDWKHPVLGENETWNN